MDNAELITGLRECATVGDCSKCKMHNEYSYDMCAIKLLLAAADALEAAEEIGICKDEKIAYCVAAIDALEDSNDAYIKENERLKKRIAELEADKKTLINVVKDKSDFHATKDAMRIAELEAQLQEANNDNN